MEFMTGVNKKETLEIGDLLTGSYEGKSVKVNGAVHTIRDMGEVAFIVLRKREGLLQCVYEEGKTQFDLKDLKEAATIEVEGTVKPEERAPHGFEIRLDKIKVLSEPAAPMPLAISKWKLNTSLEANLNNRAIALRNIRERAKFRIQEGIYDLQGQAGAYDSSTHSQDVRVVVETGSLSADPYTKDRCKKCRGRGKPVPVGIFSQTGSFTAESSVLQTDDGRRI